MSVFVAGATGAIGEQLLTRLVAAGDEFHGITPSDCPPKLGAVPVLAYALDPDQVAEAELGSLPRHASWRQGFAAA